MKNPSSKHAQCGIDNTNQQHDFSISSFDQQELFKTAANTKKSIDKKRSDRDYVFDLIDAFTAPVLTFSKSWADTIPKRMLEIVPLARMKALLKNEELATYAECTIYIYTRTLEAPMDSEWTDIYTHVTCTVLKEWFGEDHWDDIKAPKELSEWLLSKLNKLRLDIYHKRRDIIKGNYNKVAQTENAPVKKHSIIQQTLNFGEQNSSPKRRS